MSTSNRIDPSLLGTGVIGLTEFNYLDGVTSKIQDQLNSKHSTINSTSKLSAQHVGLGNVSSMEFGCLYGVTDFVQSQLNRKQFRLEKK